MKITQVDLPEPDFTPKTIQITFETAKEEFMFKEIFDLDHTIPQGLNAMSSVDVQVAREFVREVSALLGSAL